MSVSGDEIPQAAGTRPEDDDEAALQQWLWRLENVEMTTVGVDVGSSTSHLMFSKVHLQRIGKGLSSRFVVVNRETLWRSPILLTPYLNDDTIDADKLAGFIHAAYQEAGVGREDVDSGAIILTGEALKRKNARAIADVFAEESGKFVCASAGHHLEALLAAHGSGTVGLSRQNEQAILNVDIGGGTTKLTLVDKGEIVGTAAIAIGGRLIVRSENGGLVRIEGPARQVADRLGIKLEMGGQLSAADEERIVATWIDILVELLTLKAPAGLAAELMVTDPLPNFPQPTALTFSGGVSEFIYSREAGYYGDLGRSIASALRLALDSGRIKPPVLDPGQGIRATVIGASQFTVQVSGNTIALSNEAMLPLHNLAVIHPELDLSGPIDAAVVTAGIRDSATRLDLVEGEHPMAFAFRWGGDPLYDRLRALAEGIRNAIPKSIERELPIVLLTDRDVGKTIGSILKQDLQVPGDMISIDGVQLKEFDFVDIGEVIQPAGVVPVVIKSLLFASGDHKGQVE
jgi:ethanolamine utilization protein EutA